MVLLRGVMWYSYAELCGTPKPEFCGTPYAELRGLNMVSSPGISGFVMNPLAFCISDFPMWQRHARSK